MKQARAQRSHGMYEQGFHCYCTSLRTRGFSSTLNFYFRSRPEIALQTIGALMDLGNLKARALGASNTAVLAFIIVSRPFESCSLLAA